MALFTRAASLSDSSERVVLWSRGVYSSIALISAFGSVIDSLQWASLASAAKRRLDEFACRSGCSAVGSENRAGVDGDREMSSLLLGGRERDEDQEEGLRELLLSSIEIPPISSDPSRCAPCRICSPCPPAVGAFDLSLESVDLYSKDRARLLTRSLTLSLRRGMRLLITGPCGSGKSTLLRTLACEAAKKFSKDSLLYCPQQPYAMVKVTVSLISLPISLSLLA